jgi:ATP-binding cassette subfamily B protein
MENLMNESIVEIARNFATIKNYAEFVWEDWIEIETKQLDNKPVEICVNNVSFQYPMAKDNSLNGVNLVINAGETVALVGENGSGKTTLVKLLTGVYEATSGDILYNGTNIKEYDKSHLFEFTSAVFQKYQKYQMTLFDNINISSSNNMKSEGELNEICKEAGVEMNSDNFPEGYDTMLSREYNGIDLSGGQWQRVAIARALCRDHQFVVFDEPTSAIDPFEETRIYNEFAQIAENKTAIIVTHRLGSVRLADRIIVLKKGEVVQVGTHDELLKVEGEYRRLFHSQKQWYDEK